MTLQLPNNVFSSQDTKALLLEIRSYARWYSHVTIKKKLDLKHVTQQPVLSPEATEFINAWAAQTPLNPESLDQLIIALDEFIKSAPQLTITLAALPDSNLKNTLANWCRSNIDQNVLVNFRFDTTLLGGMVVRFGSRIFDWSFRRQILAGRDRFPEVLRRV